jgi:membrane-bound lytic murein transglycosylase B
MPILILRLFASLFGKILPVWTLTVLLWMAFSFLPTQANARWSPLIERLIADGFEEEVVQAIFSRPEVKFEPVAMKSKLEELLRKKTVKPKGVYKSLLKREVIANARSYLEDNRAILENINSRYSVSKEIVVAVLLIETLLGKNVGENYVFNRLASMALCTDLETIRPYLSPKLITEKNESLARSRCRQKADWAYAELKALIEYTSKSGMDPVNLPGSIYGAIGLCQFMPSKIFSFGVDADEDGRIDLFSKPDALHSIANYLQNHGWKGNMNRRSQKKVIFSYNHSTVYANTVLAVAEKLKK